MINFEERITKKSNLENNDSLSCYQEHCAQQTHYVYEVFYNFLKEVKPSQILEIGTGGGGFTLFLSMICEELGLQTKIVTYDIYKPRWTYDELIARGVEVNIENILIGEPHWTSVTQPVIDFIKQDGTTLVLCDGAYKPGEFRVLSQYLKSGDFILAHDYAKSREVFEERINLKYWNWLEVTYDDVAETINQNNLVEYLPDVFEKSVWLCTRKH